MKKARIFDIQRFSLHDGPGIRTTVFFKGCNLRCLWCHNPESQKGEPELMLYPEKCTGCGSCRRSCPKAFTGDCVRCGDCAASCPNGAREKSGKVLDTGEITEKALRDLPFYRTSGGGVTLSGGEPLLQAEAALEILGALKEKGVSTAVETAGNADGSVLETLVPVTDLFLYDLKGMDGEPHVRNTGVSNQRILENARWLASHAEVRFRMPYVPGFNDREAPAVAAFAKELGCRLELMPYHAIGAAKYRALGREYEAESAVPPKNEEMERIAATLGALYEPSGVL